MGFFNDQKFYVYLSSGANVLYFQTAATFSVDGLYHHVLVNYDTNQTTGSRVQQMRIDGSSDSVSVTNNGVAFTSDLAAATRVQVGRNNSGAGHYGGDLVELYYAGGQSLDIDVSGNRDKFDAGTLGSDGSLPTGVAPLVFLRNKASTVNVNSGSGGDFTINSAPTDAEYVP